MQGVRTHPVVEIFMGLEMIFSKDIRAHVTHVTRCEDFMRYINLLYHHVLYAKKVLINVKICNFCFFFIKDYLSVDISLSFYLENLFLLIMKII